MEMRKRVRFPDHDSPLSVKAVVESRNVEVERPAGPLKQIVRRLGLTDVGNLVLVTLRSMDADRAPRDPVLGDLHMMRTAEAPRRHVAILAEQAVLRTANVD